MRPSFRNLPLILPALRLTWDLVKDPRVPMLPKVIPIMAFVYLLSPVDIVPDILPVVGWVDDLVVVGALLTVFFMLAPRSVVAEYTGGGRSDSRESRGVDDERTVDGSFRYTD